MYTDQQIKDFIGQQGIGDNPFALYNYAKQFGVAPGRIDQVMGYAPGTSDKWIQQQGLQGLAGSAVGGTRPTAGTYTDQQVRDFISQQGIGNNPHAIQAFANQYGVNPGQIESAMGYAPGTAASWQQSAGITGQAPAGSYAPPVGGPAGAPGGAPAGGSQNIPTSGWPTGNQSGTGQPRPMNPYMPQQPQQRPGLDNPYTAWMADSIGQRLGQNLQRNILPGIRSAASAAGGLGGSRQGIAEGIAIGDTMTGYGNTLANLYSGQFNADRNYGLANDALDLNVYNANQNWMRQGQQDQLGLADRLLGWNQQYGVGTATNVQNTPLNYWNQFGNQASQFAGLGGQQSQQMQGNPYLGALGGAMTAGNLWKSWGG